MRKSDIIIIDEALDNLDRNTKRLINMNLKKYFKKSLIITTSHRINSLLETSDQIIILENNKIIAKKQPKTLKN